MKYLKYFFVVLTFVLLGCAERPKDINTALAEQIDIIKQQEAHNPAFEHKYYSYYTEPTVGRIVSDETSNTFSYGGYRFVMNLNIPNIVNSEFYKDEERIKSGLTDAKLIAQSRGTYETYDHRSYSYSIDAYQIDEHAVIVCDTEYMTFYSVCPKALVPDIGAQMLKISRTVKVDQPLIQLTFTNLQTLSNSRKTLELFQNVAPVSGVIDELFVEHTYGIGNNNGWKTISGDMSRDGQVATEATPEPEPEHTEEPEASEDTEKDKKPASTADPKQETVPTPEASADTASPSPSEKTEVPAGNGNTDSDASEDTEKDEIDLTAKPSRNDTDDSEIN